MERFRTSFLNIPFLKLLFFVAAFVFAIAFIPFIGSVALVLLPVILFFNGIVNGKVKTSAAFLISFLLLFFLSALLQRNLPAVAIFTMGMAGLLIAQVAARNGSIEKTVIYPSIFIIAAICIYFVYGGSVLSINPWQLVERHIAAAVEENIKLYSQLPFRAEDINFFKDNKQDITNGLTRIFPALVVITATLIVWANILLGKRILGKAGIVLPNFTALNCWKAPEFIIWIFIISGGLFFVQNKDITFFSSNIFLVTCFIYLLQGLAIVSFFFQKKNVPFFFRYLFYFLIAVQQILMIPIVAIGLFDIWIDFRKYFQKDQATT